MRTAAATSRFRSIDGSQPFLIISCVCFDCLKRDRALLTTIYAIHPPYVPRKDGSHPTTHFETWKTKPQRYLNAEDGSWPRRGQKAIRRGRRSALRRRAPAP